MIERRHQPDGTTVLIIRVWPWPCTCGHPPTDHWRGTGACMCASDEEAWACECHTYTACVEAG